jgi:pimeloyl-ACP methyl ester carboxylesterase
MPFAITDDGVRLYFEETGSGIPIVFVHEFAGDFRSWEPQIRQFSRQYRCITFNARAIHRQMLTILRILRSVRHWMCGACLIIWASSGLI